MSKSPRTYQRLTRPTSSIGSYNSLWLASDHLLILTSNGYTEEYQRLQLRDIKGFFIVGGDRRLYWSLAWGLIAFFSGLIMINTLYGRGMPFASGIILAVCLIALVWNFWLGPGCRAFVVTGVQTARLPSLVRQPKTRKVLRRLQPLIEAAQADLLSASAPGTPPAQPPPLA